MTVLDGAFVTLPPAEITLLKTKHLLEYELIHIMDIQKKLILYYQFPLLAFLTLSLSYVIMSTQFNSS